MPSVITITPAPSIDRTYFISSLQPGSVQRASKVTEELAGKGVNVGHALSLDGIEVSAIVLAGLGIHSVSAASSAVNDVASALQGVTKKTSQRCASAALAATSPEQAHSEVRAILEEL